MWQSTFERSGLIVLLSTLSLVNLACGHNKAISLSSQSANATPTSAVNLAQPATLSKRSAESLQTKKANKTTADTYSRAIDTATSALIISQSAVSRDDWSLATNRWQEAIKLLKAVPASSRQYPVARKKVSEYQSYLADAQLRATPPPPKSCSADTNPVFFSVPIKERMGAIPVVEVTFNDQYKFEMLFDTGASNTLITQSMASTLGLLPIGMTKVRIADGSVVLLPIAKVKSKEIDGRLTRDVPVAVAPASMPIGLLGQDFFKGYDITIKEDVIEFRHQRSIQTVKKQKSKSCLVDTKPQFFSVPIKTRKNDIPIVEVTFHNQYKFPMMFDTGASSSLITQSMAAKLQLSRLARTQVKIADGSVVVLDVAVVKSQKISGRIKRDVPVAVAPPAMDMGLLGQDFYEGYNVTIKEKVIEFRRQPLNF